MTSPISVPPHLQAQVDLLVAQALSGIRVPTGPAFDLVTSWYETLDDGATVRAGGSATLPLVTLEQAAARATDDTIRWRAMQTNDAENYSIEDVSDVMRIAEVRRHLRDLLGEGDFVEDVPPCACAVIIEASNGQQAILCYSISGDWDPMSGPDIEWEGIRPSTEVWRREHVENGVLTTVAEAEALTDGEILTAWRKLHGS